MYTKIDDIVHIREKDVEVILYVNKQAKTMACLSDIVHSYRLSELFPKLIFK